MDNLFEFLDKVLSDENNYLILIIHLQWKIHSILYVMKNYLVDTNLIEFPWNY
jgi:hypothetical protein